MSAMSGSSPRLENRTGGKTSRLLEVAVGFGALLFLLPLLFLLVTAFKPDSEILHYSGVLPHTPTFANFRAILGSPEEIPIVRWFGNSLFISSMVTLLVLTVDSLAAYALARLDLPGKRWVFGL